MITAASGSAAVASGNTAASFSGTIASSAGAVASGAGIPASGTGVPASGGGSVQIESGVNSQTSETHAHVPGQSGIGGARPAQSPSARHSGGSSQRQNHSSGLIDGFSQIAVPVHAAPSWSSHA
jgi:hypothetical protein